MEGDYTPRKLDERMTAQVRSAKEARQDAESKAGRIERLVYGKMSEGTTDAMGYIDMTVPLCRQYDDAISSSVYYRNPKFRTRRREGQPEVAKTRAEIEKRKLEYYVRETDLMESIALAFAEQRTKGVGFVECIFDDKRGYTTARFSPFAKTLVDCDTDDSPRVADLMWAGRERVYGLNAARKRWPEHHWKDVHGTPETPATERFSITEGGIDPGADHTPIEQLTQRVKVLTVYLRGEETADAQDAPQLANASDDPDDALEAQGHEKADEPAEKDESDEKAEPKSLYGKANQVAYYEVCGDGLYLIEKRKLEFVCDGFPIIPLRTTTDPRKFYAFSPLEPYYDLARQAEELLRINATAARKHAKTIMVLDKEVWTDEEAAAIESGPDFRVFLKDDLMRATQSMQMMEIGEPKEYVTNLSRMYYGLFRELSNLDALTLGAPGEDRGVERSATGSALLDKRAERLARKMGSEFQAFVDRVLRTISQIDRSLMTRAQVQKIVGADIEVTPDVWPHEWDEDAILGEYDVVIEAGSMRYVSEQQAVGEMRELANEWIGFVTQLPDMLQKMGPDATAILAGKFFKYIMRQADMLDISNPEDFLPTADELYQALVAKAQQDAQQAQMEAEAQAMAAAQQAAAGAAGAPVLPPPGPPAPAVESEITPQALSVMAEKILSGEMLPEQAPPEAALMAAAKLAAMQQPQPA